MSLIDTATFSQGSTDQPGLVVPFWDGWVQYETDPETQRSSIEVSSEFYPGLSAWYDDAFDAWCRGRGRVLANGEEPATDAINRTE